MSIAMFLANSGSSHALDYADYPELVELVELMTTTDGYPRAQLVAELNEASLDPAVPRFMDNQYEALPWHQYRRRFVNAERIGNGVAWWQQHSAALQQAARDYGVSAAVVVALIGVETNYGTRMGHRRVLDSLVTLTADYPRRSAYFSRELRAFLNAARAENIAPGSVRGSFAGAVGIPQFMPTSYQAYAVDLNQNGSRDLVNETEDAIGSVANYLKQRGWRAGQAVFAALPDGIPDTAAKLVGEKSTPKWTAAQLSAAGVVFDASDASAKMALLRLRAAHGDRYFIAFNNFHTITHYNPSINYAMAVAELAVRISAERGQ